jgi:6-phosphogluconolactonase
VYVGTYTGAKSKGIYACRWDATAGRLSAPELAAETPNPSFLALHPNRRFLYAVSETDSFDGKRSGAVAAFAINTGTGGLTLLNQQPSGGTGPCHLSVDRTGRCVLVANYGSGSIAALPVKADGSLGEPASVIQHRGSSVNVQRQQGPHAHQIVTDAANRFAWVCDLGLDQVLVYRLDPAKAALTPNAPPFASVKPGSGPRHLTFHPSGRFAYVINELSSTVTTFACNLTQGTLKELQTVSTLPDDFKGSSTTAEIEVHPSGSFVYGSNRGHDSLAVFAVDAASGKLTFAGRQPTQGRTPRCFGLDPTGRFLLAANQDSDSIVVFAVDARTGRLKPTGQPVEVPSPVCVRFMPLD